MKRLLILLVFFSCIFPAETVWSQKKDPRLPYATNLRNTIIRSMRKPTFKNPFKNPCDPKAVFKRLPTNRLAPDKKALIGDIQKIADTLIFDGKTGVSNRILLVQVMESKKMTEYIALVFEKDYAKIPEVSRKKYAEYYYRIKRFQKNGISLSEATFTQRSCKITVQTHLKPLKWYYRERLEGVYFDWEVTTHITVNCGCKPPLEHKVRSVFYEHKTQFKGVFNPDSFTKFQRGKKDDYKLTFQNTKGAKLNVLEVHCCPAKKPKKENSSATPEAPKNSSLPDQSFGGNIGLGFSENLKEVGVCVGAEYLNNVTSLGNNALYVGGQVNYLNKSYMEFRSNTVSLGPTAQVFTPINPNNTLHLTNGVSGSYLFGNTKLGDFENDLNGFSFSLNSGVNLQLNSNLSIGIIVPVLSYQNLTFKGQEGFETKANDTQLFVSSSHPIKIGARFGF